MKPCKTIYPSPGWLRVLWPKEQAGDFYRRCLQFEVGDIPGCYLSEWQLEVPYTAFMLEPVIALLEELGAKLPREESTPLDFVSAHEAFAGLHEYQLDGVEFMTSRAGTVLADEMGLGKTRQALCAADLIRRGFAPRPVLIIGPLFVQQVWRRELQQLGLLSAERDFCALESRDIDNVSFWRGAKWYFVHYEVVRAWWNLLYRERPVVTIIDEAHYIKNGKAQRSIGAALATSGSRSRILLTGTPMENRPSDLWHLLTVACGVRTWGSPSAFRTRYCGAENDGYGLKDKGPTNVAELRERIAHVYLRRSTKDANLDLPEFTRSCRYTDLGRFEAEYNAVARQLNYSESETLESMVRAIAEGMVERVLSELIRLRQITSRAKVPATREFVINTLEQGESVVVFTWERETAKQIYNGLGSFNKLLAHGEISQAKRNDAIDTFQQSEDPTALVTTYGAMAEGVTLHRARISVLHDLDWVLSPMLQAEKRVHRLGQRRACQAIWMLAEKSVDTLIAPILLRKAELMQTILGIQHDIQSDVRLSDLVGRKDADFYVAQAFAAWDGVRQ